MFNSLTRIIRVLPPVLLAGLLAGCSAMQTAYNFAPTALFWWIDGYVDVETAQNAALRDSLAALQQWHRREELPAYADLLRRMQTTAAKDQVNAAHVCSHVDEIRPLLQRLALRSSEQLAPLVPTLQAEQLSHLARQFDKHNRQWRKDWLDGPADDRLTRRLERTLDRYEDFYGRLTDTQKELLRQRLTESSFDARQAWTERLRRQQDILRVLQEHRSRPTDRPDRSAHIQAEILALIQRSLDSPDPAYRTLFERSLRQGCQTLALLHQSASPAQRQHLMNKLRGYEGDFRELIKQP